MRQKTFIKLVLGIVAFALLLILLTTVVAEPLIGKKIRDAFNKSSDNYLLEIGDVNISIIKSGIELENVTLIPKQAQDSLPGLRGKIAFVNFEGIKLLKALFRKDIDIREVNVSNIRITGKTPFPKKDIPPTVSSLNIRIDSLFFDNLTVDIESTSTAEAYSVNDGILKIYDLQVNKRDTLSPSLIKYFDFDVQELCTVYPDSMYTFTATGINYSEISNKLAVDSFSVHPNYSDSEFAARHRFETDRFEARFSRIFLHGCSAVEFVKSGRLTSSWIEIERMDMNVFRDKRKEFRHVNKPAFQDMIYNYPGIIDIDSIGILSGNITYIEHVEKATDPGRISFNELKVRIYSITNDTVYKTEKLVTELRADALLMGKAKMTVLLKAKLFDRQNTFTVNGSLAGMEVSELNPMLDKNAFIFASAGTIDAMNFSFTANNTKATGQMILLYHGLDLAVKNKRTDNTTAIIEKVMSLFVNEKIIDSNPIPGKGVRIGIINQERDTERFLFNYSFKSILSGIESSITKSQKK